MVMSVVSAVDTKLEIDEIEVKIDGKKTTVTADGETIGKEAAPGSSVEFQVNLINLYTKEEDVDYEDIEITITIEEIDDGDDLEDNAEISKVRADRDKSATIEFDVPYIVDEDTFDVVIEVEGDDEFNSSRDAEISWTISLDVEKEKHELIVNKAGLNPATVSCGKDTYLELDVLNIGSEDEEEVVITLESENLNFDKKEELELDSGTDDDSRFRETYFIDVPETLGAGTYPIEIKVYYNEDRLEDTKKVDLIVEECPVVEEPEEPEEEEEEEEDVEVIMPEPEEEEEVTEVVPIVAEETFWDKYGLALIIAAYIVVILIGILVLVKLFKK